MNLQQHIRGLVIALAATLTASTAWAEVVLVMGEEKGCIWCARWNAEVGPEYAITEEGRAAPLRRVDIHQDLPADLEFAAPLVFTPTFVLMRDGVEIDRLEGYPGEDFFWGLLQRMLDEADIDFRQNG